MKKTIFKRPLFVNPQAYATIPELYSINKLQSFNFDENDTYTTKLVYNGRVESIIKKAGEEHILHLDLYTLDGSCVLGEWYVKGIDSESVVTIDKNILTIVANNNLKYPGLIAAWSAKGKTNEDADRNILKDLTGNGHDITLNNFAYSGMSGYGGYKKNFTLINTQYQYCELINEQTIRIYKRSYGGVSGNQFDKLLSTDGIRTIKLKVSGITEENKQNNTKVSIASINTDGDNWETYDNGVFEASYKTTYGNYAPIGIQCYGDTDDNINITVELLPEYPDALVFDGIDDYGYNKTIANVLGTNREYTVIAKRKWIQHKSPSSLIEISPFNSSQFLFEHINNLGTSTFSMGIVNYVSYPDLISYQIMNSYNGQSIKYGTNTVKANDLYLGCLNTKQQHSNIALYSYYIFNRTLPDQEIKSFINKYIDSDYLLPSEIPPTTLISNDTLIDNTTFIKNN